MEYENVTQGGLFGNAVLAAMIAFIFRKKFHFVASAFKIIGHGNADNNLESPCTSLGYT
jgi:hypothetical protein